MGYLKQELIAGQVEVGDRVPPPRPAQSHLAWNQQITAPVMHTRKAYRWTMLVVLAVGFVAGFGVAFALGVF